MKKARDFLEADDPSISLALASSALTTHGFAHSGEALALRWLAGSKLVRDRLSAVVQRASLKFGDSLAYLPETSIFLTQSRYLDESLLWEFSPDSDGEYQWEHGRERSVTKIGESLREAFGAWGMPRFLGFDPINNALYLERCVFLPETKAKVLYGEPNGSGEALKKAIREGVVVMIGKTISNLRDGSENGASYYPAHRRVTLLECGSSDITDRALVAVQPALLTVDRGRLVTAWDGTSRRYKTFATAIECATLVDVSMTGSKWCIASSGKIIVGELRGFMQSWERNVSDGANPESGLSRLQFSCDEKLILACMGNRDFPCMGSGLLLLDAASSETLWEWEGSYRDAAITMDSRFLVVFKEEGFEYFELEWSYRKSNHSEDWRQMVCFAKAFMAEEIASLRESTGCYDFNTSGPAVKLRQLLRLVGLGERSENEITAILRQAIEEGCGECDPIIFDDFEAETGQAAFPFFWDYRQFQNTQL